MFDPRTRRALQVPVGLALVAFDLRRMWRGGRLQPASRDRRRSDSGAGDVRAGHQRGPGG